MVAILRLLVVFSACLIGWNQASALNNCSPFTPPPVRYVGDVAHDTQCTDDNIQHAIDNLPCQGAKIVITGEHTYTAQHLNIADKSLSLSGTTAACGPGGGTTRPDAVPTQPIITISGTSGASVLSISGNSNVTLQYLTIKNGSVDQDGSGGGIYFSGAGSVTLDTDTISNNTAGYGGGIDMSPSGAATLTLLANTYVIDNIAGHSGGGIRIEGNTRLFMLKDNSTVSFNTAQFDYGGGIEVLGPARADIGSSGALIVGAVSQNSAPYGGGVAIISTGAGDADVRLFSTNATTPVEISSNQSTGQGGGVYLLADADNHTGAVICGRDFRIDLNTAPDGAAIFATDTNTQISSGWFGTIVDLNTADQCGPEAPSTLGAVPCDANTRCNEIFGNASKKADSTPNGSVIAMTTFSNFKANRVSIRQNSGAQIVDLMFGFDAGDYFRSSLIVDNHSTHELIHSEQQDGSFSVDNTTIANNTIDDGYVIFARSGLNLNNDLIAQPNNSTLDYQQGDTQFNPGCDDYAFCLFEKYIVSSEIGSMLGPDFSLQSNAPLFVDPGNSDVSKRDYHLLAFLRNGIVTASPAMDFAPSIAGEGVDLDNDSRDQDVPLVSNVHGISDVGAYEMRPIPDRIFGDAFGDATSLVY